MALSKINWWGVLGIVVGVLSLLAGMGATMAYIHREGKEAGRNEIRLEQSQADNAALKKAAETIARLNSDLRDTERQIYEDAKNDPGCVSDSTRRQLERMQRNQNVRDGGSD